MAEDDYDLMPHKEIIKLRDEVSELRKALAEKNIKSRGKKTPSAQDVSPSMEKLTESINNLLDLFKIAGEDIRAEDHHPHEHFNNMNIHLSDLNDKMNTLIKHNEEIAKGILVVAEMIQQHLPAINHNTKTTRSIVEKQKPMQRPVMQKPIPPMPPMYGPVQQPQRQQPTRRDFKF